jgi:hypothetical protein
MTNQARYDRGRRKEMLRKIAELNDRIGKGRALLLAGDIDAIDFKSIRLIAKGRSRN